MFLKKTLRPQTVNSSLYAKTEYLVLYDDF